MNERTNENFIMLPTVDFCFKELMQNPKVRKGLSQQCWRKTRKRSGRPL